MQTAPGETTQLREQLKRLPKLEEIAENLSVDGLEQAEEAIGLRRLELEEMQDQLAIAEKEVSLVGQRPEKIASRLSDARTELSQSKQVIDAPLAENASADDTISRLLEQAHHKALVEEIEMLEQEQLSQRVRQNLALAKRALLQRQTEKPAGNGGSVGETCQRSTSL